MSEYPGMWTRKELAGLVGWTLLCTIVTAVTLVVLWWIGNALGAFS